MKERSPGPLGVLLAVPAAVSLAVWAFEEISVLAPALAPFAEWASLAGLALDACILGFGSALAALAVLEHGRSPRDSWIELLSSLPVIVLASAPLAYAYLEGRPEAIPFLLLAFRSLRILRLRRILPDARPGILVILAFFEVFRAFAQTLLPDTAPLGAALRLLLLPEALLLLGAAAIGAKGFRAFRSPGDPENGIADPVVGQDELAGLLGKRSSW